MKFQLSVTTWLLLSQRQDAFVWLNSRQQYRPGVSHRPGVQLAASGDLKDLLSEYSGGTPSIPEVAASVSDTAQKVTIKTPLADEFLRAAREQTSSVSSSVDTSRAPADVSTVSEYFRNFKLGGGDQLRETTEALKNAGAETVKMTSEAGNSLKSALSVPPIPEGKAPILSDFFKQQVGGTSGADALNSVKSVTVRTAEITSESFRARAGETVDALTYVKGKFELIGENIVNFFSAPAQGISASGAPVENVGWLVAGLMVLLAAGSRTAGASDMRTQMYEMVAKEALAVEELTGEMRKMADEVNRLNSETSDLRKKLRSATNRLSQKELEIGRERLKLAEKELQLSKEVTRLEAKAQSGTVKAAEMQKEIRATKKMRTDLVKAMDKVKQLEIDLRTAQEEAIEVSKAVDTQLEKDAEIKMDVVDEKEMEAVNDKEAEKEVEEVNEEEQATDAIFFATEAEPVEEKAAKKEAKKTAKKAAKKATTKAATKAPKAKGTKKPAAKEAKGSTKKVKGTTTDWKELSSSTLQRKTVKDLTEYLESKGVSTTDESGNALKKSDLVDAVLAL